ncbi:MAG: metal-dependent hydrolase, partial [Chloroflexota bacterium]
MPSPLAHLTAGYVVYEVYRHKRPEHDKVRFGPVPALLIMVVILSLLPDIDSVVGVLTGDFGRFHNNLTHSLFVGFVVALVFGILASWKERSSFWPLLVVALFCYELHVMMDALTVGRGVMALWPFSSVRILSPLPLFYGLHWSDGLRSWSHMVTLLTEA